MPFVTVVVTKSSMVTMAASRFLRFLKQMGTNGLVEGGLHAFGRIPLERIALWEPLGPI